MDKNKLILAFALNVKNCIDFLKVNKNFMLSRRLHGAKKNLIRYLLANYVLIEYKRVLQFNKSMVDGHCMVKFTFDVDCHPITFHLPIEDAAYVTHSPIKFTSKNVRVFYGRIPVEAPIAYYSNQQVENVIKLLNDMNVFYSGSKPETQAAYTRKLEKYVSFDSPLKLSL
jgi:hypothetical protein